MTDMMICNVCNKKIKVTGWEDHMRTKHPDIELASEEDTKPDWDHGCEVCGQRPIVPLTGMCGPCTFGKADTYGGNW